MADGARKDRFQDYVKENFGRIREENPGLGMGGWMGILGQGFREERERGEKKMQQRQDMAFDDVARKLDFLTLAG